MMSLPLAIGIILLYFCLLFAVAFYADRSRARGRSLISNPFVYSLSLAVYITAWTFYGTVGRAATVGLDFLPPVLGPTLIAFSWWFLLRKMVRVSKEQNITTIADFLSSRYGKSELLGTLVTVFAVLGILPYIALQLKAISRSFDLLLVSSAVHASAGSLAAAGSEIDIALIVALILGLFGVLFGARHLDSSERHEGLVAAVALESLVKLIVLLVVGLFVCYGLFDGFSDIFRQFLARFPERADLLRVGTSRVSYASWLSLILVGMAGVMVFPRQFQVMVIENTDEEHIKSAMWQFPAYLCLSSFLILPVALAGVLYFGGNTANADYFALLLPLKSGHPWLAFLVFFGGLSAGASMVIVSAVALSPMILNHLLMPLILRLSFLYTGNLSRLLINLKRLGIFFVIFMGYFYFRLIGEVAALADIGLVSFIAAAQFAPALLAGLYWRRANTLGALTGLSLGFLVWFYTLIVPALVHAGWWSAGLLERGPWGLGLLRPQGLFGLNGFDPLPHALFWSLFFNVGALALLSILTEGKQAEREQADSFIDVFIPGRSAGVARRISRAPTIIDFVDLMGKFIGERQAGAAITEFLEEAEIDHRGSLPENQVPELKSFTERTLAASVGTAPARIIVDSYLAARGSELEEVFDIFGSVTITRKASREQLGILYEAARLVAGGDDLQTILDKLMELLIQQFKFDMCVVRMYDEAQGCLVVRSQRGMSSDHLRQSERQPSMDTYIGECFLTNTVAVFNDTDLLDKPVSARIIHREGITAFAHAPITIEGTPVGVLTAFSKSAKGIFSEEFIELFKSLAGQIGVAWRNALQAEKLLQAREKARELEIARTIQLGLLPTVTPAIDGLALAGVCLPAHEVGGDYYDFLPRGEQVLDVLIADVSGHSVSSAMTMGWVRTLIRDRAKAQTIASPAALLGDLNEFFYEDLSRAELFITMFYLSYDVATHTLCYANAGHNPPLLYKAGSGELVGLDADGLILGIKERVSFEEKREQLGPGDLLLLYTDGLTEAEDPAGRFFGEERLSRAVRNYHRLAPQKIIDRLLAAAGEFSGAPGFRDDITLIVMKA